MAADVWAPFKLQEPWRLSSFSADDSEDIRKVIPIEFKVLDPIDEIPITEIPDLTLEHVSKAQGDTPFAVTLEPSPVRLEDEGIDGVNDHDFWDQDFNGPQKTAPALLTWESFQGLEHSTQLYLSESSQAVFDTLAHRLQPSIGALPQDAALRSLCSLALGRSSLFYQWNENANAFEATLQGSTISGYTMACSDPVVAATLKQGTLLRRLQDNLSMTSSQRQSSAVFTALERSVVRVIDVVESWIAKTASSIRSLLQLERMVSKASQILLLCQRIYSEAKAAVSDAALLSTLSSTLQSLHGNADVLTTIVSAVLQIATKPWRAQLLQDIGLSQTSVRRRTSVNTPEPTRDSSHGSLGLLTQHDQDLLTSITRERALLETHDPDHPLLNTVSYTTAVQGVESLDKINDIVERATALQADMEAAILQYKSGTLNHTASSHHEQHVSASKDWAAFDAQAALELSLDLIDPAITLSASNETEDHLEEYTRAILGNTANITPCWLDDISGVALQPAASIRPLLDVQSRLTHRTVVSLLFETHHLKRVFDLHRQTYLMGHAGFVNELSSAFFEVDEDQNLSTSTTRRRRRGLGLNTLTTSWPPTSSDLSLNLIGTLDQLDDGKTSSLNIPKMSFAVRELPEAVIEKVCNPASIHALDFIRLQCTITSPLDNIFNAATSKWYDEIFSSLLLHTRMLHFVIKIRGGLLQRGQSAMKDSNGRIQAHCINRAYNLVTTMASHAVEVAAHVPWREMQALIDEAERSLAEQGSAMEHIGLDSISQRHQHCLSRIRRYLFIGRRYEQIRDAQQAVYTTVLHSGRALLDGSVEHDWTGTSDALSQASQHLVLHLEETKHKLGGSDDVESEAEGEAMHLLLERLR